MGWIWAKFSKWATIVRCCIVMCACSARTPELIQCLCVPTYCTVHGYVHCTHLLHHTQADQLNFSPSQTDNGNGYRPNEIGSGIFVWCHGNVRRICASVRNDDRPHSPWSCRRTRTQRRPVRSACRTVSKALSIVSDSRYTSFWNWSMAPTERFQTHRL